MHILIAPDSFKESLSAQEVARALETGFKASLPHASFDLLPLGDGGEGTMACLQEKLGFAKKRLTVTGPFGRPCEMTYAVKYRTAMFEVADLIGLGKIPLEERHPLAIETRGLGELLLFLAEEGYQQILIGVGGSSSNDGGIGLAAGLGYDFYDQDGQSLPPIGQSLGQVTRFSKSEKLNLLEGVEIKVLVDVTSPLCGPEGATKVFSAQKGLPLDQQEQVDQAMAQFYRLVDPDLLDLAGAGAGGGLAGGFRAFAGAKLVSGIDQVLDLLDYETRVEKADLVIVGEGRLDRQSLAGKTPVGVARRTPTDIPVLAICGSLAADLPVFPTENIQAAFPIIAQLADVETTLADAERNLIRTARNIGNLLNIKKSGL